jgi:transposase
MPPRKKRTLHPPEYKKRLVDLVRAGRKVSELSREFGVHVSSIHDWVRKADVDDGVVQGVTTDERTELARLRRENAQLREEREILKKFAAWSAQEGNWTPSKRSGS